MRRRLIIFIVFAFAFFEGSSQCRGQLKQAVDIPFPISYSLKENLDLAKGALENIRTQLPNVQVVKIPFQLGSTTELDWLSVLDLCNSLGFKVIIGFADPVIKDVFRPLKEGGVWNFKELGDFVACEACINHSALYAVNMVDEPWEFGIQGYTTKDLQEMYSNLKATAPLSADFKIFINFSREVWLRHYQGKDELGGLGTRDDVYWSEGICDIVQISSLEFKDFEFDTQTLNENHLTSRRIIHEYTPDIPLWTSIQVFGQDLGPSAGSWFPRRDSLLKMMDLVYSEMLESEHNLDFLIFQKWDASAESDRSQVITLGDVTFSESESFQSMASAEAISAINDWFECITGVDEQHSDDKFAIYPNPAKWSSEIYLQHNLSSEKISQVQLWNVAGQNVFTTSLEFEEEAVNAFKVTDQYPGFYLCIIIMNNGTTHRRKLIIQ